MRTVTVPAERQARPQLPKRLLALAGDDRLVEQIRRGNEAAFTVAFERHSGPILSFCRHMLGSREEAEDAAQHTFAAAYRSLLDDDRDILLKPWLYAVARNRCVSVLRARREQVAEDLEIETAGLQEHVLRRAELRELLRDLGDLPPEQREALLLAELGDLSHAEIAGVLECEVQRVKALVFRARSGLMERREARDMPCAEVREQLSNLRGGSLRRSEIRHHLRVCEGCRGFREEVRRQRQLLAAALPVIPSAGLKGGVLAAILGHGGGSAGGGAAAGGVASVGSSAVAKLAVAGLILGGGAVAGTTALHRGGADPETAVPVKPPAAEAATRPERPQAGTGRAGERPPAGTRRSARRRAHGRKRHRSGSVSTPLAAGGGPTVARSKHGHGNGNGHRAQGRARKVKKPKKVKSSPPRARTRTRPPKAEGPPAVAPAPAPRRTRPRSGLQQDPPELVKPDKQQK